MDSSSAEFPSRSPRRELQGPRPAPLKVRKDSHKIKKPPVAPPQQGGGGYHQQQPHQYRPPVIIYTVSPKVIHTNPNEFMTLVQRLTGASSSSSSSSSAASSNPNTESITYPSSSFQNPNTNFISYGGNTSFNSGAISPAARYATIERTNQVQEGNYKKMHVASGQGQVMQVVEGVEMGDGIERTNLFPPGILSPGPGSFPPIPPSFFSPLSSDPNSISNFFHDLSPARHGNRNYMEGSYMPSPSSNLFLSPLITSPATMDIFNNFLDFSH